MDMEYCFYLCEETRVSERRRYGVTVCIGPAAINRNDIKKPIDPTLLEETLLSFVSEEEKMKTRSLIKLIAHE